MKSTLTQDIKQWLLNGGGAENAPASVVRLATSKRRIASGRTAAQEAFRRDPEGMFAAMFEVGMTM